MDEKNFFVVVERGDVDALRVALEDNPELVSATATSANAPGRPAGSTSLHLAVNMGRIDSAKVLIDAGVSLEARTCEGRTALHDSIEFNCAAVTQRLIEAGVYMDICSAAILGRPERIRELLDAEPNLAADESTGLSPLGWAAYGNKSESVAELLDRGAPMDPFALLCAASVGHTEVGRLLIDRGADPNRVAPEAGGNALHAAAAMRYTGDSRVFIQMLIHHGADLAAETTGGDTALQIAEKYEALEKGNPAPKVAGREKRYDLVAQLLRKCGTETTTLDTN